MPSLSLGSYVYSHNSGLQAQSVLYTQPSPDGDPTVLLDPNTLSSDGTVALGSTSFSEDGTMMAYTLSSGGSDWRTVHVLRVDQADGTPSPLADKLDHAKFTSLAWTHDGKGFFYHRYPPPAKAADLGTEVDSNVDKEMWCVLRFIFFGGNTRQRAHLLRTCVADTRPVRTHSSLATHANAPLLRTLQVPCCGAPPVRGHVCVRHPRAPHLAHRGRGDGRWAVSMSAERGRMRRSKGASRECGDGHKLKSAPLPSPAPLFRSYLLISVSSGCEPTNRLFVVDIDALPRGDDGVLDLSSFDRRSPDAVPFPVVKLVDTFDAAYDYVANEGSVMTFHTNLNAPRYR